MLNDLVVKSRNDVEIDPEESSFTDGIVDSDVGELDKAFEFGHNTTDLSKREKLE